MKPLIILFIVFAISLVLNKIIRGHYYPALSARIALAAMLIFTAVAHFIFTEGMTMMLPDFIPFKTQVVLFTGLIEIAAAIGLLIPNLKVVTGYLLIVFFVFILPANIYASLKHVNLEKASLDGDGIEYLWFRIPLQILFIIWTYLSAIKY